MEMRFGRLAFLGLGARKGGCIRRLANLTPELFSFLADSLQNATEQTGFQYIKVRFEGLDLKWKMASKNRFSYCELNTA